MPYPYPCSCSCLCSCILERTPYDQPPEGQTRHWHVIKRHTMGFPGEEGSHAGLYTTVVRSTVCPAKVEAAETKDGPIIALTYTAPPGQIIPCPCSVLPITTTCTCIFESLARDNDEPVGTSTSTSTSTSMSFTAAQPSWIINRTRR
jgi:hypothetical protein